MKKELCFKNLSAKMRNIDRLRKGQTDILAAQTSSHSPMQAGPQGEQE